MTDSTGRRMKIIREQDLGGGTYWFVAEEEPSYGVSEIKEVNHG
jgi:hypothetical protein